MRRTMRITLWCVLGHTGMVIAACGGTDSSLLGNGGGNADGGDGAVGSVDDGGGGGGGRDSGTRKDSGTASDSGVTSDSGAGSCPDVVGSYVLVKSGPGCGDLVNDAPQCIVASGTTCTDSFESTKADGGPARGINGDAVLGSDGSFTGAALTEGTIDRTGCTGSWNPTTSTMTVTCGGSSGGQSCIVMLTRTGLTCN